jgi:hypothetical protein
MPMGSWRSGSAASTPSLADRLGEACGLARQSAVLREHLHAAHHL